ncbi:Ferritin light chain, oocyte isoform [Frankliniella fusca]|uniref:Ferritin n=2 Tax=Arthropoda TaxID=6656 RepID=A0AAE1LIP6_9NEOP|nr:Ferritin light chain, oocyte isoform [Frankliniella fusca]
MKGLLGFVAVALVVALASAETIAESENYCYHDISISCSAGSEESSSTNCNAVYGNAGSVMEEMSNYVNTHITRSFQYLLMSTHFGSYEANRPGFEKLFRILSDQAWNHAQDLIKHMTKRGGRMDFDHREDDKLTEGNVKKVVYELRELEGLARALDIQKSLAKQAFNLHKKSKDPELNHYLEEAFIEGHADTIRNLAGHTADLKSLSKGPDASLSVYLFDEYLFNKLSG